MDEQQEQPTFTPIRGLERLALIVPKDTDPFTEKDEAAFHIEYSLWLTRGMFNHILDEDWERWLRQKHEVPAARCRHGRNPLHCNTCYFET
jgi:hypothetical protein